MRISDWSSDVCSSDLWVPFETGGQVNAAIAAGRIDFGAVGTPPAAAGISAGLPYRGLFILNMLGSVEGLVVRADLPISAPTDLSGKRIAVPFGSTSYYLLLSLLRLERSEEHTSELQSLMRISYADFCL